MRMRSPIVWFGGKGMMAPKLLPLLPPKDTYKIFVEVFGGGANLLFAKEPGGIEIYNDLDSGLVTFFRVLRDPRKFGRFYHYAIHTPYSRQEFLYCRDTWTEPKDEVIRAYRWYVKNRMSFSGMGRSWGRTVTSSTRKMAEAPSSWNSVLAMLPEIHQRVMRVQIEQKDFRSIINDYDSPETYFYCDPPYVPETRRDGKYNHELTLQDHQDLVQMLLNIKGQAMLSGYAHPVHRPLEEAGWERRDFETTCTATGRTRGSRHITKEQLKRIETVWISPKITQGDG
jgi:DNA adenine methylase